MRGYVAWRATLPERALSPAARKAFEDAINYQVLPGSHILVYPIPALDESFAEGDRLINMVWYVNVAAGQELDQLMTGRDGVRRAVSLPPGAATDEAVAGAPPAATRRRLLARTREIGDASQFTGAFDPGDPPLIFGLYEPGH
jgi:2,6-dihydroxypyridine 3-monooxygenase